MFWTKFLKTFAKILLALMLIGTIIASLGTIKTADSVLAGLLVLVAGSIGSLIMVSGIMFAVEVSENIGAIKDHLLGTTDSTAPLSFNSFAQNLGVNLNQGQPQQPNFYNQPAQQPMNNGYDPSQQPMNNYGQAPQPNANFSQPNGFEQSAPQGQNSGYVNLNK